MDNFVWGKTIIESYGDIIRMAETLQTMIKNLAYASANYTNNYNNNTLNLSEKILKMLDRKYDYCNLKVIIDETLKKLDENSRKILIMKYIDKMSLDEMSVILNVSRRTIDRRIITSINSFCIKLNQAGFDNAYFENIYYKDNYLKSKYEQMNAKSNCKNPLDNSQLRELEYMNSICA